MGQRRAYTNAILILVPSLLVYLYTSDASLSYTIERLLFVEETADVAVPSKFEKIWPTLQNELCPNYNPRYRLGVNLFKAARRELDVTEWNVEGENDEWFYNGRSGDFGNDNVLYQGHDTDVPFQYRRMWKCANNQIRFWLEENFRLARQTKDLSSLNPQPCIFTVVRDPISHFLSGYNEFETRCEGKEDIEGDEWCTFPIEMKDKYLYRSLQKSSPERFKAYVSDLLTGYKLEKWWNHKHTNSMTHALTKLNREGGRLTGYLPSIENITTTLPPFLNSICPGTLNEAEVNSTLEILGQHESSNDPLHTYAAAKSVWNENGATARALCAIHAMDYACWRDLPGGVPKLCQDVYSSDMFLDIVKPGEKEATD